MTTMKVRPTWLLVLLALTLSALGVVGIRTPASAAIGSRAAIYGGGPFYEDGQAVIDTLRRSGFTTVMLWAIHLRTNGDLFYNDHLIVSNGRYVGDPAWPGRLRTLRLAPTSVNRIEVSVGSAGPNDWALIASLVKSGGTGPGSILYRNFSALKAATGADAINDDDEAQYDLNTTTSFARMTNSLGFRFTFAPFTNVSFWRSLKGNLGASVDRVYLQAYAGGTGNNPAQWSNDLGMKVDPGLWSKHGSGCSEGDSPASVQSKMKAFHSSAGIVGGFMWLYDDMKACASSGSPAAYASAVRSSVGWRLTTR
jgi:hypothetical protein